MSPLAVGLLPLLMALVARGAVHLTRPPSRAFEGRAAGPGVISRPAERPRVGQRRARPLLARTAGAIAVLAGGVVSGPLVGAGVAIALFWIGPRWRVVRRTKRTAQDVATDLPDAIDLLVALVRSGLTPLQSMGMLAERAPPSWRPGFVAVEAARHRGLRLADALDELAAVLGPPAQPIVDTLAAAERYGHALGPALERLADDGRAARRRVAEAEARRLPVRLSFPLVCCTLPSFVLLTIAPLLAGAFSSLTLSGGRP